MGIKFWVSLVILLVLSLLNGSCLGCSEEERIALLHLKTNINFPNRGLLPFPNGSSLPTWNTKSNCCHWEGVSCSNNSGRVIQLNLDSARDFKLGDWYFNASMFLPFKELRNLSLSDNQMVGCVENEGCDELSSLRNLVALELSGNTFHRSILSSLSKLSSLKHLGLSGCFSKSTFASLQGHEKLFGLSRLELLHFSGNYGVNITNVTSILNLNDFVNLKKLYISQNNFESFGTICGSKKLEDLNIGHNDFNNDVFSSIQELSSLKFLSLWRNDHIIIGSVEINKLLALTSLVELDLSYNLIANITPSEEIKSTHGLQVLHLDDMPSNNTSNVIQFLRMFPNLKNLHFEDSNLEGTLLAEFRHLRQLEGLFLGYSSMDQSILQNIGVITSLKYLSLSGCGLNGKLPDQGWCELKHLEELDLSYNELGGELPPCIGNMTSLHFLDLSYNKFIGNVASSALSNLVLLEYLSLSSNNFQVPVSFELFSNNSNLRFLFAQNNEIAADTEMRNWVPRFQLEAFTLSYCTVYPSTIPNFLLYQSELRYIDLSHNNFGLNYPNWLVENNTKLETLFLSNNGFIGSLKFPLRPSLRMKNLDISANNFSGEIPAADISAAFPNLCLLNMSENAFDGVISSSFGALKSLFLLDLSNNKLSGKLPRELFTVCSSLSYFKISNNKIRGQISINGPQLEFLSLDGNEFSGLTVSENLSGTINSLDVLDISRNSLIGKIPMSVSNLISLSQLHMSNNRLGGSIPKELCKLRYLEILDLSVNNFYGSVPPCFSNLEWMSHIYLNNNHLDGQLTCAFCNSSSLATLDLRNNKFKGSIPQCIGNMSSLSALLLRDNQFEGAIPDQLCQMTRLSMIDISHNRLYGKIPHCLGKLTMDGYGMRFRLSYYNINARATIRLSYSSKLGHYYYYFTRPIPVGWQVTVVFGTKRNYFSYKGGILYQMSGIDLSSNKLYGQIPCELGNLTNTHALNLSHNDLTGTIPTTFSSMHQIESLDLSYNNLSGRIPVELTKLTFLEFFSVAYNNLSGSIPDKGQFSFDERSYEGNPFLCGLPLHACGSIESTQPPPTSNDGTEESGFLDMESFYVSFVVTYVCALLFVATMLHVNPYWRKTWFDFIEVQFKAIF